MFRAILLEKTGDAFSASLKDLSDEDLAANAGDGDVVVDVAHSTVNYKTGWRSRTVRRWSASGRWCPASTARARSSRAHTPHGGPATASC